MAEMPIACEPEGTVMSSLFTPLLIVPSMFRLGVGVKMTTIVSAPFAIPDRSIVVHPSEHRKFPQLLAPKTAALSTLGVLSAHPAAVWMALPLTFTGSKFMNPVQAGHPLLKTMVIASVVTPGPNVPAPEGIFRPQA